MLKGKFIKTLIDALIILYLYFIVSDIFTFYKTETASTESYLHLFGGVAVFVALVYARVRIKDEKGN